jgi:DNA-binding NtrC family response regulator
MAKKQRIRVLIVDNDSGFTEVAKLYLERTGYVVTVLNDSGGVLVLLKSENFHVMILDLNMPDQNSEDLLEAVRKQNPHLCVIVATGSPSVESALRTMKQDAFDYLQKPFDIKVLEETIQRAVRELGIYTDPEEELKRSIGGRLRTFRKTRGFTLKTLSVKTGLSQSLISKIELGNTAASVSTLLKLSNALNVHIKNFFE